AERDAANQKRKVQLVVDAVFAKGLFDLRGELARRLKNESARHPGASAAALQHRQHRQCEGRSLTRAGLGDAQNVAALEGMGNSLFLNRRRRIVARRFDGFEHFLAQAEFVKFHLFSLARMPCIRWFVIWGPLWTASMTLRILARKLRATLEPLFALGKSPHRSNRQKVKSTRAVWVCLVVAVGRNAASQTLPRPQGRAQRDVSKDAPVDAAPF